MTDWALTRPRVESDNCGARAASAEIRRSHRWHLLGVFQAMAAEQVYFLSDLAESSTS